MDYLTNKSSSSMATNRSIFAPKAGKAPTKGQKQIDEENLATIKFYQLASAAIVVVNLFFWYSTGTTFMILSIIVYTTCIGAMKFMAKPANGGIDLNMEAGFAENLKDLMILTWIMQLLSLISNYSWYLSLLVPAKGIYMLWTNVLGPWFFAPAPEEPPQDVLDKKQRKMERRMKQSSQVRYR